MCSIVCEKRRRELTEGEEALERKKQEHDMAMEKLLQEVSFTEKLKQTLTENRSELLGQQNDLEVERMALQALKESVQQQQASLQEEKQQATSDRLEVAVQLSICFAFTTITRDPYRSFCKFHYYSCFNPRGLPFVNVRLFFNFTGKQKGTLLQILNSYIENLYKNNSTTYV